MWCLCDVALLAVRSLCLPDPAAHCAVLLLLLICDVMLRPTKADVRQQANAESDVIDVHARQLANLLYSVVSVPSCLPCVCLSVLLHCSSLA